MSQPDIETKLREALDGVTPGPWHIVIDDDGNPLSGRPAVVASDELDCGIVHWDGFVQEYWHSARGEREMHANARLIALCSPDNIGALLDTIAALRKQVSDAVGERDALQKKLSACRWYWPEYDTSSDMCGESPQEIVQNAYDWEPASAGDVIAVAHGGIVEITYCAALPPADDADSDDDFWVEELTHEAASSKIDAEKARRATLPGGKADA